MYLLGATKRDFLAESLPDQRFIPLIPRLAGSRPFDRHDLRLASPSPHLSNFFQSTKEMPH